MKSRAGDGFVNSGTVAIAIVVGLLIFVALLLRG